MPISLNLIFENFTHHHHCITIIAMLLYNYYYNMCIQLYVSTYICEMTCCRISYTKVCTLCSICQLFSTILRACRQDSSPFKGWLNSYMLQRQALIRINENCISSSYLCFWHQSGWFVFRTVPLALRACMHP